MLATAAITAAITLYAHTRCLAALPPTTAVFRPTSRPITAVRPLPAPLALYAHHRHQHHHHPPINPHPPRHLAPPPKRRATRSCARSLFLSLSVPIAVAVSLCLARDASPPRNVRRRRRWGLRRGDHRRRATRSWLRTQRRRRRTLNMASVPLVLGRASVR